VCAGDNKQRWPSPVRSLLPVDCRSRLHVERGGPPGPPRDVHAVDPALYALADRVGLRQRRGRADLRRGVLLVIIWPANLQSAITAQQGENLTTTVLDRIRLPLQIPLIWFALQSGRGARSGHHASVRASASPSVCRFRSLLQR